VIPCVVYVWMPNGESVPVAFTSTYRRAKKIKAQCERFDDYDIHIVEAWNWPRVMGWR